MLISSQCTAITEQPLLATTREPTRSNEAPVKQKKSGRGTLELEHHYHLGRENDLA